MHDVVSVDCLLLVDKVIHHTVSLSLKERIITWQHNCESCGRKGSPESRGYVPKEKDGSTPKRSRISRTR